MSPEPTLLGKDLKKQQQKEYNKRYQQEHAEKIKAQRKQYYLAHKEKLNAYRKAHREQINERVRRKYRENPSVYAVYGKKFREKHPNVNGERCKKYRAAHLEECRERERIYRLNNRDRSKERAQDLRTYAMHRVYGKGSPECVKCGCRNNEILQINHLVKTWTGKRPKGETGASLWRKIIEMDAPEKQYDIRCQVCNWAYLHTQRSGDEWEIKWK